MPGRACLGVTSVFEVLAEPRRRQILDLVREGECSVNELVARLEMNQPAVSKHLRVLREAGLVRVRVDEQRRLYRLTPASAARTRPVAGSLPCGLGRQPRQAGTAPGPDGPGRDRGRAMTAGKLEDIGGRWRLRFTRELAHPQEKVWRAITEPEHMRAWFPQHVSGDWVVGGPLTFSGPEGRGPDFDGEVLAYQPQSLVEFRWGTDVIRLELAGRPDGCTLTCWTPSTNSARRPGTRQAGTSAWTGSPTTSMPGGPSFRPASGGPRCTRAMSRRSAPRPPRSARRRLLSRGNLVNPVRLRPGWPPPGSPAPSG